MSKNLYAILGVAPNASLDEIRAAYAAAAERAVDAVQRLALKEALGTLSHEQRRAAYDASLHDAPVRDAARPPRRAAAAKPASASSSRAPMLIGLLLLGVAGAWWGLRPTRVARVEVQQLAPTLAPAVSATPQPLAPAPATDTAIKPLSAEELFARASASVVRVNANGPGGEALVFGSGVVVDTGSVITNCHVAQRGATLKVRHGSEQFDALIATADEAHDLCRLSVPGLNAAPVTQGRVAQLRVGQKVFAIGSPQGLDLTLSDGMVSSLREGPEGTLIQTTAPISPGSSGGGLFDEAGRLVGIVTFQMRSGQNLNFALPVDWIGSMTASAGREPAAAPPPPVAARDPVEGDRALLAGSWHCFGPLTGRGLDVTLDSEGNANGTFDGKPIAGRYLLQGRQLTLMDNPFRIEELTSSRLVLSQGQGRRLVCNH